MKSAEDYVKVSDILPVFLEKFGMQHFNAMTGEVDSALKHLTEQINDRPPDTDEVEQPKYLKVELMKHQLQALWFMMWRETWKPRGGILADGKKLKIFNKFEFQLIFIQQTWAWAKH